MGHGGIWISHSIRTGLDVGLCEAIRSWLGVETCVGLWILGDSWGLVRVHSRWRRTIIKTMKSVVTLLGHSRICLRFEFLLVEDTSTVYSKDFNGLEKDQLNRVGSVE